MSDPDFLQAFLVEALEILEQLEYCCLNLEKEVRPETLNDLFRLAHNLKGSSRSVGLEKYGQFVHQLEDLFTELKAEPHRIDPAMVGLILEVQATLVDWTEKLQSDSNTTHDTDDLLKLMRQQTRKHSSQVEMPSVAQAAFGFFEEDPSEIAAVKKVQELTPPKAPKQNSQESKPGTNDETIRVSLKRLDSLIRLIGELSIQHSIIANAKDNHSLESHQSLDAINLSKKVIQDLQSEAMSLRMQPLEGLFQRLERTARDVARSQSKAVDIILQGNDVELDKTVIERMKDPLIHIIRNAVDHGLENGEDRRRLQKSEPARLIIEGRQSSGNVIIRIEDNGRGLDAERIKRKAIEKALISPDSQLSESEIYHLIFLPGFSTAEKITDVSGRGVGMDVVNKAVTELNGSIEIDSKLNKGTCFEIILPSTLSIMDAIIIQLGQLKYAIPVQDIEEVVDLSTIPTETTSQKGRVLNLRGRVLPVERLSEYLPENSINADRPQTTGSVTPVALITQSNKLTLALEVDAILGQQSIVVRKLEGKLSEVPGFSGGTILASGEPSMILQLAQIVRSYISHVA